jgi:clan AA aspartic protease (TIGR02281 family)
MRLPLLPTIRAAVGLAGLALCVSCRSVPAGPPPPDAESIVEGTAGAGVRVDSVDAPFAVGLERGRWRVRNLEVAPKDFWDDISRLDVARAEHAATSFEERTFVAALTQLMSSDPEAAAIAFSALHRSAQDPLVRSRSRVGLTMALTWNSDWESIAGMQIDPDTLEKHDAAVVQSAVERWAQAFARFPQFSVSMPPTPVILPLRRSAFGTPVVRVMVNGRPFEFWLDTGASMTLISADVAVETGVKLAALDTLALGVVSGHIDARAVYIDSLAMGGFVAHGLTAAVVSREVLRLDHANVDGRVKAIPIDGVIGADLIRRMDLVIDAAAGTLTISRPRRDSRASRNLFWVGYPVVRLVSHDGQPLLFGLDTGAEGSYVTMSLLRKLPRTPVAARRNAITGLGTESTLTQYVVRDIRVSDGDYAVTLRNAPIAPDRRWTFVNFDGVIGSDVAMATRLHLDFTNGVFDVRPTVRGEMDRVRVTSVP